VRIFMLPGWMQSTGARLEYDVARFTGRWVYSFQANGKHVRLHAGKIRTVAVPDGEDRAAQGWA
jgi:hypothetical protein